MAAGAPEGSPAKLRVKLLADPQVGFTPLVVVLTATVTGITPGDPNFCHPAVTWIRVNPGQLEENASRYHEDAACRHPADQVETPTTFTKSFELYRTGSYLFRLMVEGKDRRRAESAFVRVEVLRVQ